jgi:hypothetical protein
LAAIPAGTQPAKMAETIYFHRLTLRSIPTHSISCSELIRTFATWCVDSLLPQPDCYVLSDAGPGTCEGTSKLCANTSAAVMQAAGKGRQQANGMHIRNIMQAHYICIKYTSNNPLACLMSKIHRGNNTMALWQYRYFPAIQITYRFTDGEAQPVASRSDAA